MTLVLEIEYLLGAAFAAKTPDNPIPDWPPQPDRVFSALVASWGARGKREEERRALEWLETQEPPGIFASPAKARTTYTAYVPPNDYRLPVGDLSEVRWYRDFLFMGIAPPEKGGHKKLWRDAWNVMPDQRKRTGLKDRRFVAARPDDPIARLIWRQATPDSETLAALNAIAGDTAYVGHSASLTRCRFRDDDAASVLPARTARRRIYPGRLAELQEQYRLIQLADPANARAFRPKPGAPVRQCSTDTGQFPTSVFSGDWLVLEHVGGEMPDIRAAALVAKEIRNAVMSGYRETGLGDAIPAAVSGHSPDGRPSNEPHLAIAPLAFVGSRYASGNVLGFALIPPRDGGFLDDPHFQQAVRRVLKSDSDGRRVITVRLSGRELVLAVGNHSGRISLNPAPYIDKAHVWASCTPIVLDRHLKEIGNEARDEEIGRLIRQGCKNVGLPEPCRVSAGKHSAIEGSPSAYPSGSAPRWTRWRLPQSLASRQLVHTTLEFPQEVRGPVILGAGRFVGLGLCLPLAAERRP